MNTRGMSRTAASKVARTGAWRRCAESRHGVGLALLAMVTLLGGCADDAGSATSDAPDAVAYRRFTAVEMAREPDSARAFALRDSLEAAGWVAYVRSSNGAAPWRIRVAPGQNMAWAEVTAAALPDADVVQDSGTVVPQGIAGFTRVSYESPGMIRRLRWVRSPDLDAILVMEDATEIENDPAPNGFVFASEAALNSIQMDSVWDAAPAPDWQRVAFGRAYVLRGGRADTLPTAMWRELADTLGLPTAEVRRAGFPSSGMAIHFAVSQLGVARLDPQADSVVVATAEEEDAPVRLYPVLAGWRVAWGPDGNELLAGTAPAAVRDDSPARAWVAFDPLRGEPARPVESAPAAVVPWVEGPTIDISVAPDTGRRIAIGLPGADSLVSERGWIRLGGQIVGPGVALTATRTGRYIVALAPNPSAEEYEPKYMAVVYLLGDEPRAPSSLR